MPSPGYVDRPVLSSSSSIWQNATEVIRLIIRECDHDDPLVGGECAADRRCALRGIRGDRLAAARNAPLGRTLVVVEAGLGFGFLALLVSYLPVLYQAFSRREASISMLDARAGSPPSAAQALIRAAEGSQCDALEPFLREWERWSAEVLESHLSYPVLSYYRSQHDNQSWLAALTA